MKYGESDKRDVKLAKVQKLPIPDRIVNRPRLSPGLEFYYHAYIDLATCRGGMGDGFIPWNILEEWCDRNHIFDIAERTRIKEIVRAMDLEYIKYREAETAKRRGKIGDNKNAPIRTKEKVPIKSG